MSELQSINDNELNKYKAMINDKTNSSSLNNDNDPYKSERIADQLVEAFSSPENRLFYVLVADKMAEGRIWELVERSKDKGDHPAKLFTYLTRREMKYVPKSERGSTR